jgi:Iodothyronine deiodinase
MRTMIILLFSLATIVIKANATAHLISADTVKIVDTNSQAVNRDSHFVLKIKEAIPEIYFYDSLGNKIYTDSIFNNGRPVIFAVGSYSCTLFRNSVKQLNKYLDSQKEQYDIYFIYVTEAHPVKGSPYGVANDNIERNRNENINIQQQKNIADRILFAVKARKDFKVKFDLLIDNEHNDFFHRVFSGPTGTMIFSSKGELIGMRQIRGVPDK